jgi:glycosyltransferase involved in cell wall biosynthesis
MKTKIKLGYGHMDMNNSVYEDYIQGNREISEFDPTRCRTGTHYTIVDALGGDKVPIDPNFDYSKIDCDLVYFWFQGGCYKGTDGFKALQKIKKQSDALVIINWEEAYWFTDVYVRKVLEGCVPSAKVADAVVSGFRNDDERMKRIGIDVVWRYLVTPYDVKWLRHKFGATPKVSPERIYTTVHGRATRCDRALVVMNAFKNLKFEFVVNRYRFFAVDALKKRATKVSGIKDFNWLKIIDPLEPWLKYMNFMAGSFIFLDEYPARSQSHTTIDAACGGTPTISHNANSAAVVCFPKLLVELNNLDQWVEVMKKLLMEKDFYEEVRQEAFKAVDHYSIENFLKQLEQIYSELKK